jgi:hypothetical protein
MLCDGCRKTWLSGDWHGRSPVFAIFEQLTMALACGKLSNEIVCPSAQTGHTWIAYGNLVSTFTIRSPVAAFIHLQLDLCNIIAVVFCPSGLACLFSGKQKEKSGQVRANVTWAWLRQLATLAVPFQYPKPSLLS